MSLSIGQLTGYVDLDTAPAESAADKLGRFFESKGGSWGKTLAKTGAVAAGLFSASLAGAINLEPSRDRVAAALDLTKAEAARAGKVSGDLYADAWGESAADVDMAIEAVMSSIKGMRSASEAELRKVTEAALTVSTAFQVDVVRASQVAGNMIANGMAKNGVQAMDLLAAAMSKVPVQLREDVLDATDEYGQFFTALGIKGPQAMNLLAASAGKGMYGIDKMGDAIKEFTIRATDGSTATTAALSSVTDGPVSDLSNALLAGGDKAAGAFNKIVDGVLQIKDPTKQASTALALFGTPLEDLGTKDIPKFLRSMQSGRKGMKDWQGATERMGETLNDNAATNLSSFGRQLKSKFIDLIGGKVLPTVTDWSAVMSDKLGPTLDRVGAAVENVTEFLKEHKGVTVALALAIGTLTALTVAHAAALAVAAAGGLSAWLLQTRLISAATRVWAAVQWAMNAALAANPIGIVIALIAGFVAGVIIAYKKSDTFRAVVSKAFEAVKRVVSAVFGFLKRLFTDFPGTAKQALSSLGSKIRGVVTGAMESAKQAARNGLDWIRDKIASLPARLIDLGGKFTKAGKSLIGKFFDGLKQLGSIAKEIGTSLMNGIIDAVNWGIQKVNDFIPDKVGIGPASINLPNNPFPKIDKLATGGRATAATLAIIGEGKEPESVLPDSVLRGLLERAHNAGRDSAPPREGRSGPMIGTVNTYNTDPNLVAEQLWFKTRTRG